MNDRNHILETLGRLGVDVDRLLHRALTAERLVRGWMVERGIASDEGLVSALPELLSAAFPMSLEWGLLASIGDVLESPTVRFALVDLIRDAAGNFARPGNQDARKLLPPIADALALKGEGIRRADARARALDERRWADAHRLAKELKGLARQQYVAPAVRERFERAEFLAWDGKAWCSFDPELLHREARWHAAKASPGARPFLAAAAVLLGAQDGDLRALTERRKKRGQREAVSPKLLQLNDLTRARRASTIRRKEPNRCPDAARPTAPAEPASPSTPRPSSSARTTSRASSASPKATPDRSNPATPPRPGRSRLAAPSSATSASGSRTSATRPRPSRRRKEPDGS